MQMGRHATKNILFLIRGDKSKPFRYFDKGSMATIGRNKAIADLKICLPEKDPIVARTDPS
jgi:NADH dehydrogenase